MHLSFEVVGSVFFAAAVVLLVAVIVYGLLQGFSSCIKRSNMAKLESKYQGELVKRLKRMYPGVWIMKNDEQYRQGTPDLTLLYGLDWAVLESKRSDNEPYQPNQEYYIQELNNMAFCRMICPENEAQVLQDLDVHFGHATAPRRRVRS